jgi:hypothetical protein
MASWNSEHKKRKMNYRSRGCDAALWAVRVQTIVHRQILILAIMLLIVGFPPRCPRFDTRARNMSVIMEIHTVVDFIPELLFPLISIILQTDPYTSNYLTINAMSRYRQTPKQNDKDRGF